MARQNTPGLGIEYEVHIPAYFALLLNNNEDVEDFKLRSNAEEFGNLDDLLIDIRTKNGEELYFAFQLKHKENHTKSLLPTNFEAKGDFNLEKYCEAFKNLSEENRKYHFILFTNKNFDCTRKEEVTKFRMEHDDRCAGKRFFNTSPDVRNVYKFEISGDTEDGKNVTKEDYQLFFSQFTLYTGQINFNDLNKSHILDILKYEEQFLKYVNFFRRWHRGEFLNKIVDKETLNVHLVDIFLAPFVIKNYHLSNGEENLELFESILRIFDLTIIDDSRANFIDKLFEYEIMKYENCTSTHFKKQLQKYMKMYKIDRQQLIDNPKKATEECLLRLGKEIKIIDRYTKELKNDTKLKLFYYFFEKLLIVDFNETSKELIYQAMELYKMPGNKIKFVLLGEEIDTKKFHYFQIFENLKDLLRTNEDVCRKIIRRCRLSLQGRSKVSLEELVGIYEEIADFTGPKEIFQMLKDDFTVGEIREELPQYYIPRTVSTPVFNLETVLDHCTEATDTLIINFADNSENFKNIIPEKQIEVLEIQNYLERIESVQNSIIVAQEECSKKQFEEIRKINQNRNVHYLKLVNEEDFLLVMSSRNTFRSKKVKFSKMFVDEQNIPTCFDNPVNIFCASPGMGKSTLLSSLKNQLSSEFWPLRIDLKAHNTFLKEKHNSKQVLHYFMQLDSKEDIFLQKLKNVYLQKRQILILMDGLDEIEHICVDNILEFTKQLSEMGYRVWLSSRQNLQQKLEEDLNIFALDIEELSKAQQTDYVLNKLQQKYEQEELEEIVTKIFNSADIIHNQPVLGVPLQLHIITEIFLNDRQHQMLSDGNIFILTKMFRIFFEGRYEHSVGKLGQQNLSAMDDYLQNYEIAALQSLFDDHVIDELDLDLRRNLRFVDKIKKENDPLGIIVKINNENKAVFQHLTFGEYFVSVFLINNLKKGRILKKILFSEKYENLFLILNMMMAEESPLHLAVIHKDINQIENDPHRTDKGGRSLLHLAVCNATRYPLLQYSPDYNNKRIKIINDLSIKNFAEETPKIAEIIKYLLTSDIDLLRKDELFEWDPLEYALAYGSLYAAERILEKLENVNIGDIAQKYHNDVNLAYYTLRFGYAKLLSSLLANQNCPVNEIECLSLNLAQINGSILNFSVMSECANQTEIVDVLGNVLTDHHGRTLLHFATLEGNKAIIEHLLRRGAKVNSQTTFQRTPLHYAATKGDADIINLLLSNKADLSKKDGSGRTALCIAAHHGHLDAFNLLLGKGAKCGYLSLNNAIQGGNVEIIKTLLKKCSNINRTNEEGATILHNAIYYGNVEVVKMIMKRGADLKMATSNGDTILHYAVKSEEEKMFEFVLQNTAHLPYVANKNGATPLHLAVYQGNTAMVRLLLWINLDRIDANSQRYPLYFAQENGRLQKQLLLKMTTLICNERRKGNHFNLVDWLKDKMQPRY